MDRSFASGAAGSPPSYPGSPSIGYPTAGNPSLAVPATKPGPWWYYMINEELRAVLVAAGITPDGSNTTQLLQAIQALIASGTIKIPVRAASTANIATLAGGAPNTLDGVTLAASDRLLLKDQSTGSQNGLYVVTTLGTGANGTWTRATDADGAGELMAGTLVTVQEGTTYADSIWELSTDGALTIGTTALTFTRKDVQASISVPIRQTVLSGPVDTSGLPSFGGSTGSTTVTASGTLKVTAMAGGDANYTGSITNPSWTGLSTNGQMYLYADVTSGGVVTTASSTVQHVAQPGGTPATTNGLLTTNYQEGKSYLGNGSTAPQAYRVPVGEVTVAGGVVTAITWYALMGRYVGETTFTALTKSTVNHNLGVQPSAAHSRIALRFSTAQNNYAINDEIPLAAVVGGTNLAYPLEAFDRMTSSGASVAGAPSIYDRNTLGLVGLIAANVKMKFYVNRGW
jgi:hypothetical protein